MRQLHGFLERQGRIVDIRVLLEGFHRIDHVIRILRLVDRSQHIIARQQSLRGGRSGEACVIESVSFRGLVESF